MGSVDSRDPADNSLLVFKLLSRLSLAWFCDPWAVVVVSKMVGELLA